MENDIFNCCSFKSFTKIKDVLILTLKTDLDRCYKPFSILKYHLLSSGIHVGGIYSHCFKHVCLFSSVVHTKRLVYKEIKAIAYQFS